MKNCIFILLFFQASVCFSSSMDVKLVEALKNKSTVIDVQELKAYARQVSPEVLDFIFFRLNYELSKIPDINDGKNINLELIEVLIQIVVLNAQNSEYIAELTNLSNMAGRKLYFVQNYYEMWKYQLDLALSVAQYPMVNDSRKGNMIVYMNYLRAMIQMAKAGQLDGIPQFFRKRVESDIGYFSDSITVIELGLCKSFFTAG